MMAVGKSAFRRRRGRVTSPGPSCAGVLRLAGRPSKGRTAFHRRERTQGRPPEETRLHSHI